MRRLLNNILILSLIWIELTLVYMMFLIYWPTPVQKIEKFATDIICPYSQVKYDYKIEGGDLFSQFFVTRAIEDLNQKMGYNLFTYNATSKNHLAIVNSIPGFFSVATFFGETIG